MSLCPCCGRWLCDHSPEERRQTVEEMMKPLTENEIKAFESGDGEMKKVAAAKAHIEYIEHQIQLRETQNQTGRIESKG